MTENDDWNVIIDEIEIGEDETDTTDDLAVALVGLVLDGASADELAETLDAYGATHLLKTAELIRESDKDDNNETSTPTEDDDDDDDDNDQDATP